MFLNSNNNYSEFDNYAKFDISNKKTIENFTQMKPPLKRASTVYTGCGYTYSTKKDRDRQCGSGGTSKWIDDSNLINNLKRCDTVYTGCGYTYSAKKDRNRQCGSGGTSKWIDDRKHKKINWEKIDGTLKNVSASGKGWIWGVNRNDVIYKCKKPCNGSWSRVSGDLKQVSGGDNEIWGVNRNNIIYKGSIDGSGHWKRINGTLKNVSASGKGWIWGVNRNDVIYKCKKPCNGKGWIQVSGHLKQISGGNNEVWGVNSNNKIFKRPIDGSGNWTEINICSPGGLKHVSASDPNWVWGVSSNDNIYKCKKPCNGNWINVSGEIDSTDKYGLKQVSSDDKEVWGVNSDNLIFKKISNSNIVNNQKVSRTCKDFTLEEAIKNKCPLIIN